jgi:hypothetical protein
MQQLGQARLVFLYGWTFRAPTLVRRYFSQLRAYFQLEPQHELPGRTAVAALRRQAQIVIGVHIRYGDYRVWRGGKYYFPLDQYVGWMRQAAQQFHPCQVGFVVASDELRQPAEFSDLNVQIVAGLPVEDSYALSQCDYIMGPPSSFSQWASFYGQVPLLNLKQAQQRIDKDQFFVSALDEIPM